jgi:hypothetical protein
MRVIYIADDGKEFDNEYNCKDYEWKLNREGMDEGLHMYDINGDELTDYLEASTYNQVMTITIDDEDALQYIKDVSKYTGFCEYDSIDKCGMWVYEDNDPEYNYFGGHFKYLGEPL